MFYTNYKKDGNVFSKIANQTNELAWFTITIGLQLVYNYNWFTIAFPVLSYFRPMTDWKLNKW